MCIDQEQDAERNVMRDSIRKAAEEQVVQRGYSGALSVGAGKRPYARERLFRQAEELRRKAARLEALARAIPEAIADEADAGLDDLISGRR